MVRGMLETRFHLQLHTEVRQAPAYELVRAKGGFRLREVTPTVPPIKEGPVFSYYGDPAVMGSKSTMAGMARSLTAVLNTQVINRTGLTGYYDFDVSPDSLRDSGFGVDGIGLLILSLRSQFGLSLVKTTGPVQFWVVDHMEPPSNN